MNRFISILIKRLEARDHITQSDANTAIRSYIADHGEQPLVLPNGEGLVFQKAEFYPSWKASPCVTPPLPAPPPPPAPASPTFLNLLVASASALRHVDQVAADRAVHYFLIENGEQTWTAPSGISYVFRARGDGRGWNSFPPSN